MAESNKNGVHGDNNASFEQSFQRLQEVVQTLSEGNLTLEEALSSFEEGMALADRCVRMLDEAELRLQHVSSQLTKTALGKVELPKPGAALEDLDDLEPIGGDGETVSFEVASYDERVTFSVPPDKQNLAYSPLPGERRGSQRPAANNKPAPPAPDLGKELELDPLFDEDD